MAKTWMVSRCDYPIIEPGAQKKRPAWRWPPCMNAVGLLRYSRLGESQLGLQLRAERSGFLFGREIGNAHAVIDAGFARHRPDLRPITGVAQLIVCFERGGLVSGIGKIQTPFVALAQRARTRTRAHL